MINKILDFGMDMISSYETKTPNGVKVKSLVIRPAGVLAAIGLVSIGYMTYKAVKEAFKKED